MNTRQLLIKYYKGLAVKKGWEDTISDDFKFVGGDMTRPQAAIGRKSYIEIISRFSILFTSMRVIEMIIRNDKAFVLANYDYLFPDGFKINGNVAEYWMIRGGKLNQLTIFFDTLNFQAHTQQQSI